MYECHPPRVSAAHPATAAWHTDGECAVGIASIAGQRIAISEEVEYQEAEPLDG